MDETRILELVGGIYEAALDPSRLATMGEAVQRALDIESSIHFVSEKSTGRMLQLLSASENFDAAAQEDYANYYHERNEWFKRAVHREPPYVARGEELLDYRDFDRTEFCADWCRRVGIYHMIGCVYPIADGVVGGSGVHKTKRQGAFTDGEKRLYATLMSHFARALQLAHRLGHLEERQSLTLEVIDALDVGVMLVRADSTLVFANRISADLLRQRRWMVALGGRLRPIHHASAAAFARNVAGAASVDAGIGLGNGGLMRLRDPVGGGLSVLIAPFRSQASATDGRLAVVVFQAADTGRRSREAAIAQAYDLSEAEARLVAVLVQGATLVEAAARLRISANTAKTQLRAVFAKTGFSRQTQLVGNILANAAVKLAQDASSC
jgi:DNA-binding CsgD family transcriptional regulator